MISSITSVLTGIEQPDGYTIANAQGFTDNDDNGDITAKFGQEEHYDEDTGDWLYTGSNDAYYAVYLTAGVTYALTSTYNGFSSWEGPYIRFEDASGNQVGTAITVEDLDEDPWIRVVPGSFTPPTTGVYYLHAYCDSYATSQYTVPLNISPRPGEYSCVTRRLWEPYPWEKNAGGGYAKTRHSGLSRDVLVMPLLSNATPTVNTAGATFESSGTINYDGTGASASSDDYGNRIKVFMPGVFAGSFTVTLCFNPVSNNYTRRIFELRGMTPAYYNDQHTIPVSFIDGKTVRIEMYGKSDKRLLDEEVKKSVWHCISMAVDRERNEARIMLDGKKASTCAFSFNDVKNGIMGSDGCINLFGDENGYQPELGKIKQLLVTDSALGYDQMRYLSSKLLS